MDRDRDEQSDRLATRHLAAGWTGLGLVTLLGLLLEGLHAFKVPLYLDAAQATTRLMWRLAHAHLGVLSLTQLGFAFTLTRVPSSWQTTSRWLLSGTILVPLGFLLGGVGAKGGDPGLGVVLLPPGAVALSMAFLQTAVRVLRHGKKTA